MGKDNGRESQRRGKDGGKEEDKVKGGGEKKGKMGRRGRKGCTSSHMGSMTSDNSLIPQSCWKVLLGPMSRGVKTRTELSHNSMAPPELPFTKPFPTAQAQPSVLT